jgi:S-adenosylmethionine:tRNA ribosyltransferase-isomerase
LQVSDFDYELPEALIAQEPLAKRDHSRLLVVDKKAETFQHTLFTQIGTWLSPGDLLVFNDTKVIPARLWGRRLPGGGRIEVLLLSPRSADQWEVLVRPGRKVPIGQMLAFGTDGELTARAEERTAFGGRTLRFSRQGADLRSAIRKSRFPPTSRPLYQITTATKRSMRGRKVRRPHQRLVYILRRSYSGSSAQRGLKPLTSRSMWV